jgi:transcriptional regulator with GAF, ATPase, and Fis domain
MTTDSCGSADAWRVSRRMRSAYCSNIAGRGTSASYATRLNGPRFVCKGGPIAPQHLSLPTDRHVATAETTDLGVVERQTIERVVRRTRGNKSRAAKRLALTRTELYGGLRKYGLDTADS